MIETYTINPLCRFPHSRCNEDDITQTQGATNACLSIAVICFCLCKYAIIKLSFILIVKKCV